MFLILFSLILIWRRFLLGKFADMQTFAGESMTAEGGMAFGYYKEGAHSPTFAYISKALEAEKVGYLLTRCGLAWSDVRTWRGSESRVATVNYEQKKKQNEVFIFTAV